MHNITLNNGVKMTVLGFGVFLVKPAECARCAAEALSVGYRLIDTAQAYYNEEGVGQAVKASAVPRADIFLTTKVWISNAGETKAMASIEKSLKRLQTDYIDLLLIHQPFGDVYGTYRAMEQALAQGKVRAIGLSNFLGGRFIDLAEHFETKPAVLQCEANVFTQRRAERALLAPYGTQLMAWAPLAQGKDELWAAPELQEIAAAHGLTPAQAALSFLTSQGICAIPKSVHRARMEENLKAAETVLSAAELKALAALDGRCAPAVTDFNDPDLARMLINYDKTYGAV